MVSSVYKIAIVQMIFYNQRGSGNHLALYFILTLLKMFVFLLPFVFITLFVYIADHSAGIRFLFECELL